LYRTDRSREGGKKKREKRCCGELNTFASSKCHRSTRKGRREKGGGEGKKEKTFWLCLSLMRFAGRRRRGPAAFLPQVRFDAFRYVPREERGRRKRGREQPRANVPAVITSARGKKEEEEKRRKRGNIQIPVVQRDKKV